MTTDPQSSDPIHPGQRVRIIKQVAREGQPITTEVTGLVRSRAQKKTGSWYAHSKDDKLWLDRLELVKDDGEVYICNLDAHTRVEILAQVVEEE